MFQTHKAADAVHGGLGKPSKMPGYAYGIPAKYCKVGAKLHKVPGSVCADCYALKGRYLFSNVVEAQERRFQSLKNPLWVPAIAWSIRKRACDYFRWHDSGDLQGMWHLANIVEVANLCPDTKFWLPTRENALVSQYLVKVGAFPKNLVVRVSGAMIDGYAPIKFYNTSTVVTSDNQTTCPAYKQNGVCGDCRACWNRRVRNVAYPKH
jgi:uncharacterized Fe-S cluster-containing radical SAM superfamily protein